MEYSGSFQQGKDNVRLFIELVNRLIDKIRKLSCLV